MPPLHSKMIWYYDVWMTVEELHAHFARLEKRHTLPPLYIEFEPGFEASPARMELYSLTRTLLCRMPNDYDRVGGKEGPAEHPYKLRPGLPTVYEWNRYDKRVHNNFNQRSTHEDLLRCNVDFPQFDSHNQHYSLFLVVQAEWWPIINPHLRSPMPEGVDTRIIRHIRRLLMEVLNAPEHATFNHIEVQHQTDM
jgi:hypothetical protein